jgi:Pro-kumamolisin, activation domain/Bacterial Ig-like domain (group 3)
MRYCHSSSSANRAWTRPFLMIVALCMLAAWPALAQSSDSVALSGHTPKEVPGGSATLVGHYNPNQMLRLVIGIQVPHLAEEKQFLDELKTKGSPEYRHFLTADEWNARFGPSVEDEQAVVDWAKANGFTVTQRYSNRLIVDLEASSATIEKALGVTINSYQLGEKTYFSNDRDPMIPVSLSNTIQSVMGMNNLQVLHAMSKGAKEPIFADYAPGNVFSNGPAGGGASGNRSKLKAAMKKSAAKGPTANITDGAYDPTDMYSSQAYDTTALYNQGHCCNPLGTSGGTPPESSIAIATAGTQQASDFYGFQSQYPYLATHWAGFTYVDGTPSCCDLEGTMDFDWATVYSNSFGNLYDTGEIYMYDGVNANINTFTDVYNKILSDASTRVFTTSWGCQETSCWPNSWMSTDDAIFSQMAGEGWTMFAASGDHGATASCTDSVGVMFPASDPNIVASGGDTIILSAGPVFVSQTAWSGGPAGCNLNNPKVNDGGSTGGYSGYFPEPSYQDVLGAGIPSRGVPDLSLNADWYYAPQNLFFEGSLQGNGGTSIVAPSMAGFMANENAYLDSLGDICGSGGTSPCAPAGNINYDLYGNVRTAPHDPWYDVTTGCNNNDVTAFYGTEYYCTLPGWDPVTGWGFSNMLQLAWALNWSIPFTEGSPTITFGGPTTGAWYNTDQIVDWDVNDIVSNGYPGTGIAGYTQGWDSIPSDPHSEANPGSGNSFYSGPQHVNSGFGCTDLTNALCSGGPVSQGWHTVYVMGWNNMGLNSGVNTYGPIGYDTIAPVTTGKVTGTLDGSYYKNTATVTLTAYDPGYTSSPQTGSGVKSTVFQVNGGTLTTYTAPFVVNVDGPDTVAFYSKDNAGNVGSTQTLSFAITSTTSTSLHGSANPTDVGQAVTFTATVTSAATGTPTGSVTFKNGATVLGTVALSGGVANFTTSTLAAGTHSITGDFLGSTYFVASNSSALSHVVKNDSTTRVASSANPSGYGQTVTFTATVGHTASPTPTGTVTFKNGSATLGTGTLSGGKATLVSSALTLGTHSITAVYNGDSNYGASTSPALSQVVGKETTSTTVKSSLNPSTSGATVEFTATVKSSGTKTPTGSVKFLDGAKTLGSHALSGGVATFSTSTLTDGTHRITAEYEGDADFDTSTSPVLSQVVNP